VAAHDQRCPLCRTDVSEWIRRHLFERDSEADQAERRLVDFILSCASRSIRESFSSAGTDEARHAAVLQMFQEAVQAAGAATSGDA
jgi:hypothetical protein